MSPMENVWKILGEKAQNRNPQNIDDFWDFQPAHWPSGQSVRQWSGKPGFNARSHYTKDF